MPRKRWRARLSYYDIPVINPEDRNAVEDHDLVRHALVNFDELAELPSDTREQLVADLVGAICFARAGVKAGKHGMSNKDLAIDIFMSDVRRALERAGLPATRWRKWYDNGSGESSTFDWPARLPTSPAYPSLRTLNCGACEQRNTNTE